MTTWPVRHSGPLYRAYWCPVKLSPFSWTYDGIQLPFWFVLNIGDGYCSPDARSSEEGKIGATCKLVKRMRNGTASVCIDTSFFMNWPLTPYDHGARISIKTNDADCGFTRVVISGKDLYASVVLLLLLRWLGTFRARARVCVCVCVTGLLKGV